MPQSSIPDSKEKITKLSTYIFIVGIIFVAFNLRPGITSVGPLIPFIREDTGLTNSLAGLLTTLPLLSFALFSLLAPKLGLRFGNHVTIFVALFVLIVGILTRSTGIIALIFIGTALVGVGIAICNVLLPAVIKNSFPKKVGIMTSLYTASMGVFASLGSGLSIPLSETFGLGWKWALAIWAILSFAALLIWMPQIKKDVRRKKTTSINQQTKSEKPLWTSSIAWYVTLFMGLQSLSFYCLITWIPDVLHDFGMNLSLAGWMLFWLQLIGIPFNFMTPLIADKLPNQKPIVITICLFYFIGFTGLLLHPNITVIVICTLFLGISQGIAISLSLTLLSLRAATVQEAARLSGMAQSLGYLLAAIGPIFMGYLYDVFQTWSIFIILLFINSFIILFVGLKAAEKKYVFE
ncbi:CynX/NimT family MFS transporter [Aliibacillus thermotolerans]|uniref:CynX/NimT family MFS transporter n=1 Tax=Aliibacillus thermotolerans TaxID=1834418 RepID=A0ABW0U6K2_9BACI|nr:MFS transporter [Aliibacillus thermotolerans]MDA3130887.1 MFS transporter [Aliibacillus thermotolerans]